MANILRRSPGLTTFRVGAAAVTTMLAYASPALAGTTNCEWLPGGSLPGVGGVGGSALEGYVYTTTTWDPDGAGAQQPVLVVGGTFRAAGDKVVRHVATWDGTSWSPLGEGFIQEAFSDYTTVRALAVYNGQLIAAGDFTSSGATTLGRIARWNGSAWVPLSTTPVKDMNGSINALTVYNGNLVAGGTFTQVNGVSNFQRIAQWNGSAWSSVSTTATGGINNGAVHALAVYNGRLIAGGSFTQVDSATDNFLRVAQWNGSWSALSSTAVQGINDGEVRAFTNYNGNLVAAGTFAQVDSTTDNFARVAQWSGSVWTGFDNSIGASFGNVEALAVHNGRLIAGGSFGIANAETSDSANVASWNGSTWEAVNTYVNDTVRSLSVHQGDLIAGGNFDEMRPATSKLFSIARWNGMTWSGLFNPSNVTDGYVRGLAPLANGNVAAAGRFTRIEGLTATYVAELTDELGGALPIGAGVFRSPLVRPNLDAGLNTIVQSGNEIFAGGWEFSPTSGALPVVMARYGSGVWNPTTLVAFELFPGLFLGVMQTATVVPGSGDVLVGGMFYFQGDPSSPVHVARWNGSSWTALMRETFGEDVSALAVLPNGHIVAGGSFAALDGNTRNSNIARWDGMTYNPDGLPKWEPLGYGTDVFGRISVMKVLPNGDLIVGGNFSSVGNAAADDLPARGIAKWNYLTQTWSSLNNGLSSAAGSSSFPGTVNALTLDGNGDVIVGGRFEAAGNAAIGDVAARNVARWNGTAWSALGSGVSAEVYSLATTSDGTVVVGGLFSVAGDNVSAHLARWACTGTACAADFNGVNGVTVQDIFDFLTAWLAGSPTANFNGVNGVTVQDIFDFLTAWLAGC